MEEHCITVNITVDRSLIYNLSRSLVPQLISIVLLLSVYLRSLKIKVEKASYFCLVNILVEIVPDIINASSADAAGENSKTETCSVILRPVLFRNERKRVLVMPRLYN